MNKATKAIEEKRIEHTRISLRNIPHPTIGRRCDLVMKSTLAGASKGSYTLSESLECEILLTAFKKQTSRTKKRRRDSIAGQLFVGISSFRSTSMMSPAMRMVR